MPFPRPVHLEFLGFLLPWSSLVSGVAFVPGWGQLCLLSEQSEGEHSRASIPTPPGSSRIAMESSDFQPI